MASSGRLMSLQYTLIGCNILDINTKTTGDYFISELFFNRGVAHLFFNDHEITAKCSARNKNMAEIIT